MVALSLLTVSEDCSMRVFWTVWSWVNWVWISFWPWSSEVTSRCSSMISRATARAGRGPTRLPATALRNMAPPKNIRLRMRIRKPPKLRARRVEAMIDSQSLNVMGDGPRSKWLYGEKEEKRLRINTETTDEECGERGEEETQEGRPKPPLQIIQVGYFAWTKWPRRFWA